MVRNNRLMAETEPGPITDDGCPVLVYADLPEQGEAALVAQHCPPGGSVLDLGAGTGRIADPLAVEGFDVLAVDSSAEMLAHIQQAASMQTQIEGLDLRRQFDLVLLASHLVNSPMDSTRLALLQAAARHVGSRGRVLIQWHSPEWFDVLQKGANGKGRLGPFEVSLVVHGLHEDILDAIVTYQRGAHAWSQRFQARRLSRQSLNEAMARCGLSDVIPITQDGSWLSTSLREST